MNKQLDQSEIDVVVATSALAIPVDPPAQPSAAKRAFETGKRLFDIVIAIAALPIIAVLALVLLCLNPIWNPGPLFFLQTRMGRDCLPFRAVKFRTMRPIDHIQRGPDDPVEADRITPLGGWLRRSRFDELPQFLNVLMGQMSMIGPRPDYWDHAMHYLDTIPGYRQRHMVRPGITGLAQVDAGYAEGINATVEKTRHDLHYIRIANPAAELYVLWRTLVVVLTGSGAR